MPLSGKLGILAGGGALPARIADVCRQGGHPYFVIVLDGQGDPADFADDPHAVIRLGAGGAAIKRLRAEGCDTLVMAGTIRRPSLAQLRPDLWGLKFFATSGAQALGDDGLLTALIAALEAEGFRVVGADQLLPELLMPHGVIGSVRPDADDASEIAAAMAAAKALGGRDEGQAAVVRGGTVIAEEGRGGTDAMLRALAEAGNQGGVLGKALKPGQERRADLPTIGANTIDNAHAAGLSGIAVEAGDAFLLDRAATVARADALGLFLVGVDAQGKWA